MRGRPHRAGRSRLARAAAGALRAHYVHAAWSTARRSADLPGVHLHDLRHAGLTLAAQSGATLAEVTRRAGHSWSRAAMIYQQRGRAMRRRGRGPPGAPRSGHDPEPYGHVAGTRAHDGAELLSSELFGQHKTAVQCVRAEGVGFEPTMGVTP